MPEQHIKLMQGLGVPQEQIDLVEKMEADKVKDFDTTELVNTVKGGFKTQFLNDAEFLNAIPEDKIPQATLKKVEAGQYGRFMNEMLSAAKTKLGLEDADLADLSEDDKKSLGKAFTKIATTHLNKKGGVEGAKKLQEQVSALTDQLAAKDTDWQAKLDTALQETGGKAGARIIKALTKSELATLDGVELVVPANYAISPVLAKLTAKYALVVNDNDEIELKQKDSPALDAMEGGKKITFTEALKKIVLEDKVGKERKAEDSKEPRKKVIVGGGSETDGEEGIVMPDYISKKIAENESLEK